MEGAWLCECWVHIIINYKSNFDDLTAGGITLVEAFNRWYTLKGTYWIFEDGYWGSNNCSDAVIVTDDAPIQTSIFMTAITCAVIGTTLYFIVCSFIHTYISYILGSYFVHTLCYNKSISVILHDFASLVLLVAALGYCLFSQLLRKLSAKSGNRRFSLIYFF